MNPPPPGTLRHAGPEDAETVAALHVASWRATYRGACDDAYLDGPIEGERRRVWRERFDHPRAGQIVVLAEDGTAAMGFACAFADHDLALGSLVDNLHVLPGRKGRGLGRALMRDMAERLLHAAPCRSIHLHALDTNHAARAFYERIGAAAIGRARDTLADGTACGVVVYAWSSPAALLEGCGPWGARVQCGPAARARRAASALPQATKEPLR